MSKTKEEVIKILEKNYQSVQVAELSVYDKNEELDKTFLTSVKELDKNLKNELKELSSDLKTTKTDFTKKQSETKSLVSTKKMDFEASIAKAKEEYSKQLVEIEEAYQQEVTLLNNDVQSLNIEYEVLMKDVEATFKKDIEMSQKAIASINSKSEKDLAVLSAKLEDLKGKHEEKLQDLKEKESTKLQKLQEVFEKELSALEKSLAEEKEKRDAKISNLRPVYEEELAEIDENIKEKKDEYESKRESIRSSADQRIQVRTKHLERAQKEGDSRSAKQHKKDIDKFKKEAERDIILLEKAYKVDSQQSEVYRTNFIKDNFEKLADIERDFSDIEHEKTIAINELKATHNHAIEQAKFEYEKYRFEEQNEYNKAVNEVSVKQEEVSKDTKVDLLHEEDNQAKLTLEFNKTNKINELNYQQDVESKQKDLRDAAIKKEKADVLAKDELDKTLATLNHDLDVLDNECKRDLEVLKLQEKIEVHRNENKRLNANKTEFYHYQTTLDPLFKSRAAAIYQYEELEINNRFNLKAQFLTKELASIQKDYDVVIDKIQKTYDIEKDPFVQIIDSIAGIEKAELESLQEEHNQKLQEITEKIESLTDRKDRKEKQQLEDSLQALKTDFEKMKHQKEANILKETKVYQDALDHASNQNQKALQEVEELFTKEISRIKQLLELLKTNQEAELDEAKARLQSTEANIQEFITNAASRNTSSTEYYQNYLDSEIAYEESVIQEENTRFEDRKDHSSKSLHKILNELENDKKASLDSIETRLNEQNKNLSEHKEVTDKNINIAKKEAEKLVEERNSITSSSLKEFEKMLEDKQSELKNELHKKEVEIAQLLSDNEKKVNDENHKLDQTKKQIHKDVEAALKETIQKIDQKLKEDKSKI